MKTFKDDKKWQEAKRVIGSDRWLEVISYYRAIGGKNVFVYSVIDGDKRLIVDILDDDRILLVDKHGDLITDSYEKVLNSKKVFKYNENIEQVDYYLDSTKYRVTIESHKR